MIWEFFNVNTIFFTIIGYPMSYIEFFGTLLNIWSVYLVAKNKILNWPVGIVATALFLVLFYQIQLYSDFFEQIYYLITGFIGWWMWYRSEKGTKETQKDESRVTFSSRTANVILVLITFLGTLILGFVMGRINIWLPTYFPEPASYVYWDAFTTVMSFVATVLLMRRKVEAWYLWVLVDVIGIWLYYVKEVKLISLLYVVFLILAIRGLINWRKLTDKSGGR